MSKITLAAGAAVLALVVLPAPAGAADVCNEAENSYRGGYVITETPDPNPPAFLRGEQMRVGNGHGKGLERAGERSPALQACGNGGGDTGGGETGGGETGGGETGGGDNGGGGDPVLVY